MWLVGHAKECACALTRWAPTHRRAGGRRPGGSHARDPVFFDGSHFRVRWEGQKEEMGGFCSLFSASLRIF
jgi:hypothetical protein